MAFSLLGSLLILFTYSSSFCEAQGERNFRELPLHDSAFRDLKHGRSASNATESYTVRPSIASVKMQENLSEGNRLSVMCAVTSGTPPISFVWHKDGKPVGTLAGVRVAHIDDFQDVLQIEKLTADHVGNYTCNAKNMYGADHISVPVQLRFAPRWQRSDSEKVNAAPGELLTVDCTVSAYPAPSLKISRSESP